MMMREARREYANDEIKLSDMMIINRERSERMWKRD